MSWSELIQVYIALFAIMNPVGVVPLFLDFTENIKHKRAQTSPVAASDVAVIFIVTVFLGQHILNFFSISVDAFRVAGGIFLMMIAFSMLQANIGRHRHTPEEDEEALDSSSVGVVPLAMPLMAGPGAISAIILYSNNASSISGQLAVSAVCASLALTVWVFLHLAPQIGDRMSQTAMNVMKRVMGLILAAMAVEFIVLGLKALLPGLA
jgi:multiple antibiotic resistance protein